MSWNPSIRTKRRGPVRSMPSVGIPSPKFGRYQTALERSYYRALHELIALRTLSGL